MLTDLLIAGTRTICFVGSRRGAELIHKFCRDTLIDRGRRDLADAIAPYRAGYTPQQRREIEARLSSGELRAVVATNALELGIDIGELDAAICVGFPGTVASLRQMWGRAGRRRDGLAVYLAGIDGLDQFFCRHPTEFLTRPVEAAILDHRNERIQSAHLVAAAFEAPLGGPRDDEILGAGWRQRAEALTTHGYLRKARGGLLAVRGSEYPAGGISLRSASADSVTVVDADSGELLGTVEAERAFSTVHPGAVYLHLGRSYEVRELDLDGRRAIVKPFNGDWYTQPRQETEIYIERIESQREALGVELHFGVVSVSEQVVAFQRKRSGRRRPRRRGIRLRRPRPAGAELRDPGPLVRAPRGAGRARGAAPRGHARIAARLRAHPDRRPAAAGDVRSLGHRRPLDQRPHADRPADDLHLRRPPGRRRDLPPRL